MTSQSSLLTSPTNSGKMSRSPSATSNIYRSLEDIQKNLTNLDNFLIATEDILKSERLRDFELYQRERARKEKKIETSAPPLSFKNGKIFCLGDDGSNKFNSSNIQLTHDIVKQIINNEKKFLCYDMVSSNPDPLHLSEEQEIFMNHQESEDEAKLKSFNEMMLQFSPTSTISSKIEDLPEMMKTFEEDLRIFDYNRSETMECMVVDPESPE